MADQLHNPNRDVKSPSVHVTGVRPDDRSPPAPVINYHTPSRSSPVKIWMVLAGLGLAAFMLVVLAMFFLAATRKVITVSPVTPSPPPMNYVAPGVSVRSRAGESNNPDAPPIDPTNSSFTPTNTKPLSNHVVPDPPKSLDAPAPPDEKPTTPVGGLIGELDKPTVALPQSQPNVAQEKTPSPSPRR